MLHNLLPGYQNSLNILKFIQVFITISNTEDVYVSCGPGSSVGIATDYGLDGPGIESNDTNQNREIEKKSQRKRKINDNKKHLS
jgi:hypothetical protein